MKSADNNPEAQDVAEKNPVWPDGDAVRHRASRVIAGDIIGTVVAFAGLIGARNIPSLKRYSDVLDKRFVTNLSKVYTHETPQAALDAARVATNNAILMAGGLSNPLSQYIMLRLDHNGVDAQHQAVDLSQIAMSRVFSTFTAGFAVTLAEMHASSALRSGERVMDYSFNAMRGMKGSSPKLMIDANSAFSEAVSHSLLQSVGGTIGGITFQSVFDRVIGRGAPTAAER